MDMTDSTPLVERQAVIERMARAYQNANPSGCVSYDAIEAALAASGKDELARGFWMGLDHIAGFINALDSEGMSGKEVRSAIYSECLTARLAAIAPTQEPEQ